MRFGRRWTQIFADKPHKNQRLSAFVCVHLRARRRPKIEQRIADLEAKLNDFDAAVRSQALAELVSLARQGLVQCEPEPDAQHGSRTSGLRAHGFDTCGLRAHDFHTCDLRARGFRARGFRANMHCHTFFSFNAYGLSPTGLAWLAKRRGFRLAGIVDFDVLDGVDEFLAACDLAEVRASAGVETRVFLPEFATREISSPGEPGVAYHMGIGFTSGRVPEEVAPILATLRLRAAERNRGLVERVNGHLAPVTIDYERDVLPLTPGGTATERHIIVAYVRAAERTVTDPAGFWAGKLGIERDQVAALIGDGPQFQNLIRARLMKRGGVGYVQPGPGTFPGVDEFHSMIVACGALPCATWLDGTSAGEQAMEELLDLLIGKGVVALNIIPDRNWNVADPEARRVKVQNLVQVVRLAGELALPLNVGTEMNSFGQKWVDDFDAPELAPLRQPFLDGAYFIYGHTAFQRALGLGYQSAWARAHLPARRERNDFYTRVGQRVEPGPAGLARLGRLDPMMSPGEILARLDG